MKIITYKSFFAFFIIASSIAFSSVENSYASELANSIEDASLSTFRYCNQLKKIDSNAPIYSNNLPNSVNVTRILVRKDIRKMYLMNQFNILKSYDIALGKFPVGHKHQEGDQKTPEGIYFIEYKTEITHYHKALKISYPNHEDDMYALKNNIKSTGGLIMIHGFSDDPIKHSILAGEIPYFINYSHPIYNWTNGCVAVTDEEIDEIYSVISKGTMIEICPNDPEKSTEPKVLQ